MRVEELIGARVRLARREAGLTQVELGERLSRYLTGGWSNIVVSLAETGRRNFSASELVALGAVLGRPVAWFFVPLNGESQIQLPGGPLEAEDYRTLGRPEDHGAAMLRAVALELVEIGKWAELMRKAVQGALDELTRSGIGQVLDGEEVVFVAPPAPPTIQDLQDLARSVEATKPKTRRYRAKKSTSRKGGTRK
jgi:transcriptional regulator with XRE-family HTH domain